MIPFRNIFITFYHIYLKLWNYRADSLKSILGLFLFHLPFPVDLEDTVRGHSLLVDEYMYICI